MSNACANVPADAPVLDLQHHTTPIFDTASAMRVTVIDRSPCLLCHTGDLSVRATPVPHERMAAAGLLLGAIGHSIDDVYRAYEPVLQPGRAFTPLRLHGTPVVCPYDAGLTVFDTNVTLGFDAVRSSWLAMDLRARPARAVARPQSRAFEAFRELAGWMDFSESETADLVGVGRTTPYAWQREGREPQPRHARRLYQTHALVGGLVEKLGETGARRALGGGQDGTALALLQVGEVADAEAALGAIIFGEPQNQPSIGAWMPGTATSDGPSEAVGVPTGRRAVRASRRR